MKRYLLLLISLACSAIALASPKNDRYVVVVSMDGFRWDYSLMYDTPFLDSLGEQGVYARMRPSYPSKTFPNHYTMATGLVPNNHGIIANRFIDRASGRQFSLSNPETKFDGYFYGGEPIWVTAQLQGVNAGVVYWPGSDVEVKGTRPYIYHQYLGELLSFDERITEVQRILSLPEAERPHLVMCYFDQPDTDGHKYGPCHHQTRQRIEYLDQLMSRFYAMLQSLPIFEQIDFIVTSDHGMAATSPERLVRLSEYFDTSWITAADYSIPASLDALKVTMNGVSIDYTDSIIDALCNVPHIDVWRRQEIPACYQYGTNPNIGDIVVNPQLGWVIGEEYKESTGAHGYDPFNNDLQVLFRAKGPDFKQSYVKPLLFQNTCIYPLICHLLGLTPAPVDGTIDDVKDMLNVQ